MTNTKSKEIVEVEKQITPVLQEFNQLVIKTPEDYNIAVSVGGHIKKAQKFVTEKKELITKPLNEALKNTRAMFKPFEDQLDQAELDLKRKMLTFKKEEEAKRVKLEERVERGTMKQETLVNKVQEMTTKTTSTEIGKSTVVKRTEYVVVDKSKIPLEYLVPDMVAIRQAFKLGKVVEGVEAREVEDMRLS